MDNYSQLVERICRSSGLELEEIERRVEAKKAKLSSLISKEGAAQIVAAELGINFDQERLKISELVQGMRKVNVIGKVIKLSPVREFNKNGREGKVANLVLADETSNIKTVLWDTNHISLIEKGKIKENTIVEISNGSIRNNELHLSSFSDIKESKEKIDKVIAEKVFHEKKLSETKSGEEVMLRAFIVNTFEPRYFEVCPQCGKKATNEECQTHGKIKPIKRALLNLIIDDGTETIRSVLFGEQINKLGLKNEEIFSIEKFNEKKRSLLGEEKLFTGQIRLNSFSNTNELTVQEIKDVNPNELIKELEAKG
ncbi:hypothetical protein HY450_00200 [Candidatus Pacearchaeota archaeon]|nr:hypothetical protein [Candidatus Pacearchaeota archaeon]